VLVAQIGREVLMQGDDLLDRIAGSGTVPPRLIDRPGDHRRCLCQSQRQEPQLSRERSCSWMTGWPAGALGQERQRCSSVNTPTATASPSPAVSSWLLAMTTWQCIPRPANRKANNDTTTNSL